MAQCQGSRQEVTLTRQIEGNAPGTNTAPSPVLLYKIKYLLIEKRKGFPKEGLNGKAGTP